MPHRATTGNEIDDCKGRNGFSGVTLCKALGEAGVCEGREAAALTETGKSKHHQELWGGNMVCQWKGK